MSDRLLENDELVITKQKGEWSVNYKQYLYDEDGEERGAKPFSVLEGPYTQVGTSEISNLLGDPKIFPFPKPSDLICHLLKYCHPQNDFIFLDFFAGSGTSGHAVLDLNKADGSNRKFVLVQLPEPCAPDSTAGLLPVWWTPPYANSAFISNSMGLRYPSVECRRRGL